MADVTRIAEVRVERIEETDHVLGRLSEKLGVKLDTPYLVAGNTIPQALRAHDSVTFRLYLSVRELHLVKLLEAINFEFFAFRNEMFLRDEEREREITELRARLDKLEASKGKK